MTHKPTHFCDQCGSPEIEIAIRGYMNASAYFACEEGPVEIADNQHVNTAYCGNCGEEVGITEEPKSSAEAQKQ